MDRRACQATVHRITQSWIQLKQLNTHTCMGHWAGKWETKVCQSCLCHCFSKGWVYTAAGWKITPSDLESLFMPTRLWFSHSLQDKCADHINFQHSYNAVCFVLSFYFYSFGIWQRGKETEFQQVWLPQMARVQKLRSLCKMNQVMTDMCSLGLVTSSAL